MIDSIICGDCLDILPTIESDSIDLTLFSPPYDGIRDYNKGWTFNYQELGKELYRVSKEGAICAVVIQDQTKNFRKSLTTFKLATNWCENGWGLFECCIYHRDGRPGAWWNKRFRVDHEYILFFLKGDRPKTFHKEPLMVPCKHAGVVYKGTERRTDGTMRQLPLTTTKDIKCRGTIWKYPTSNVENNKLKMKHPATFPDRLAEDIIVCFSNPEDIVLDPMCGSGTTLAMAKKNDRRYLGIDINSDYVSLAEKRLQTLVENT